MTLGDISLVCAWALVDELAAGGVRHACLSPGSRSTPIALALARHPEIEVHVHLDERSSAFVAAGIARATLRPVLVATTSGTAAAELLPAIVEASQSRTPLVALTADRPPRLRGTGANQTIDQVRLFGRYVRAFEEPPVPSKVADAEGWRAAGRRALAASAGGVGGVPGPVHVNAPFDEPLAPTGELEPPAPSEARGGRAASTSPSLTEEAWDRFADLISGRRGLLLVGGWPTNGLADVGRVWTEGLGWPVLAEPQSGARLPGLALAAGQSLISSEAWLEAHRPEVIVQLGAVPTSRATQSLVASVPDLVVADRSHLDPDPEGRATLRLLADPDAVDERLDPVAAAPEGWLESWRAADARARRALDRFLDSVEEPIEPRLARDLAAAIPDGGTLFVGNSSPIRDLDLAMAPRRDLRVLANRGASGIDGLVSTAVGVATAGQGRAFALIGDLSLVHDLGALAWNARRGVDLTIVVASNGGGELFSLLPQRQLPEHAELFLTPHRLDLGACCTALGADHVRVDRSGDLTAVIGHTGASMIRVVEVVIDGPRQRELRERLRAEVHASLR